VLLNRVAGDEIGSSFRFFADAGEDGIFRLAFVASPRIRFAGTLAGAMVKRDG
jgi:hypothetical protein